MRSPHSPRHLLVTLALLSLMFSPVGMLRAAPARAASPTLPNPILFVTQMPIRPDFTTIGSVFGNHRATLGSVGRGGDLWIRYPDGTLKNLTAAAGYGSTAANGFQGANAIAVRDPAVHWDGQKAIFSMVIGAPAQQYQTATYYWQLYEITGLGQNQSPVITKVANQPTTFNNISPIYGTDDRIIFTSDRPRNGASHLYPQRDEYELAPTVSGLWRLDPASGALELLDHSPSGDFTPTIDSFGRVIFTRWDHLQRDQEADFGHGSCSSGSFGTFNYTSEAVTSTANFNDETEHFPEPRPCRTDLIGGSNLAGHTFNLFLPWQINEDGTEAETLNHIGRHELIGYIPRSLTDDANLFDFYNPAQRFNQNSINNFLQIKEDPTTPGRYFGVDAPEFGTHAAGQIITMVAPPTQSADQIAIGDFTHPETAGYTSTPSPNHSGLYREPLPLTNGTVVAVHTAQTNHEAYSGPSIYDFRLKTLQVGSNGSMVPHLALTNGISRTLSFWSPDTLVTYSGLMWELNPVEVRARPRPSRPATPLPQPEQQIFAQAGVDPAELQSDLAARNLALIVSRNVTTRDDNDHQQPFNLRVPGGVQTIGASGKIYDVTHMQLFQADQIRGFTGSGSSTTPQPGRRVLGVPLHDEAAVALNPQLTGAPPGSVAIAADGSVAAFVPARRAMAWQLTAPTGTGVVRERVWLTFQPGEIRVCASCHGLNEEDHAGNPSPGNPPQALLSLLQNWKAVTCTGTPTDVNSDGRTDVQDVMLVAAEFGQSAATPVDQTCDGTITAADVLRVASHWQP